jgi:NADH-quinone oxidoreductase subunit H
MSLGLSVLVRVLAALVLMLLNGVVLIWMLRKVLGHLHLRIGPNRVGPYGLLQTSMDVVKLLTKEDFVPSAADKWLFRLAPMVVFVPAFMAYGALALGPNTRFSDLDTGVLYIFAVLAIVPMGIMMAGWASNSKWSLLGGMRAAAQQISYEIPLLLSVLPVVMLAGSMNLGRIVSSQAGTWLGFLPRWYILSPQIVGFGLFMVAALAELNLLPSTCPRPRASSSAGSLTSTRGCASASCSSPSSPTASSSRRSPRRSSSAAGCYRASSTTRSRCRSRRWSSW